MRVFDRGQRLALGVKDYPPSARVLADSKSTQVQVKRQFGTKGVAIGADLFRPSVRSLRKFCPFPVMLSSSLQ